LNKLLNSAIKNKKAYTEWHSRSLNLTMGRFSDEEINQLIKEPKTLPINFTEVLRLRQKRAHSEQNLDIKGESGRDFRLILRQSKLNPLDFSIILAYCPQDTTQIFRLCRYNGKSHQHTNFIEKDTFFDFHIHTATERYQDLGFNEEGFAETTSRYSDFVTAIKCLLIDCSIDLSRKVQRSFFELK